jgi:hypothetical protein
MASIQITDNLGLNANLQIRDDSPLAKAGLTKLVSTTKQLFDDFGKPVDQADVESFGLGGTFTTPNMLSSDVSSIAASAGINCGLSIAKAADQLLFPDDGFSPRIPIEADQVWVGVEVDLTGSVAASTSVNGIGILLDAESRFTCSTYTRFSSAAAPLPLLREACTTAFQNFSMATSAAALRNQSPGIVSVAEANGSITLGVSFQLPVTLNPLASANLPFNKTATLQPSVTVEVAPSIEITGDLLVRSWKVTDNLLVIGVYKEHGGTVSVSFTAGAGIEGEIGSTDILGTILNKALPGVDVAKAGITGDNANALNAAIKDGLDRSLSAQLNAAFSSSITDQAAVIYQVRLDPGEAIDDALGKALHGDWTQLEKLSLQSSGTVQRLRNIAVDTVEKNFSLNLNLFGFYSAVSVDDYLKSSTALVDESGQISLIDKIDASRIRASSAPLMADTDKLRKALMEDFVCTATYVVVAGKLNLQMTATQTYFDYDRNMSSSNMKENVMLGYALGLIPFGALDDLLKTNRTFPHACVSATLKYKMEDLLKLFFKDLDGFTPRTGQELEIQARRDMAALLDPDDDIEKIRLAVLQNNDVWKQMDDLGNVSQFQFIDGLRHLNPVLLADVSGDWTSIAWWTDSVSKVAPQLKITLDAISAFSGPDPRQDEGFMKARGKLADLLGSVVRDSDAQYVHGWSEAVTFGVTGGKAEASIDLGWSGHKLHYPA